MEQIHQKGVSSQETQTPMNENVENIWKLRKLQIIKYQDHIIYQNTPPNENTLSERIAIGWQIKETDNYVEICWDLPTRLQKHEVCDQMSGIKIMKNSIIERYWPLTNLMIKEANEYSPKEA